ncbi:MAG: type II toxin-antitoxin system HicA family toxin [Gammaproteobacteria bacterium]|nr:type II toxin-antitoxin system HicA family toxin [Gammaproteobacteria bacterium]
MSKYEKLLEQVLLGSSDANISFEELRQLLLRLGFEERIRGSHHIYRKPGVGERVNLQRAGNKAKIYQVRQVRSIILAHKLGDKT